MQWATRLQQALDEDRFVLHAQRLEPLAATAGGLHAEVLVRMVERDGSLVPPGAFLPAAERFNLVTRVDRWVLRKALQELGARAGEGGPELLSVNLSGQSVGDRAFHCQALELLAAAGDAVCRRLCIEINESAAITNMADASVFVEQVRQLGVKVALDDFGAGSATFGHLKQMKVDRLKIDGQFVRGLPGDAIDRAAVGAFVEVAMAVGARTVAKLVDRSEVLESLRELGVGFAQGYLLHRPEPLEAMLAGATPR